MQVKFNRPMDSRRPAERPAGNVYMQAAHDAGVLVIRDDELATFQWLEAEKEHKRREAWYAAEKAWELTSIVELSEVKLPEVAVFGPDYAGGLIMQYWLAEEQEQQLEQLADDRPLAEIS